MENLTPLKDYATPQFPTLEAARSTPELLKRMPHRWQNFSRKATAMACAGVMSFTSFAIMVLQKSLITTFSVCQLPLESFQINL